MTDNHGIVVKHKETGNHYAVSENNLNPKTEVKVRKLTKFESVRSFKPFNNVAKPAPVEKDK